MGIVMEKRSLKENNKRRQFRSDGRSEGRPIEVKEKQKRRERWRKEVKGCRGG
jgi:hypothetical protein